MKCFLTQKGNKWYVVINEKDTLGKWKKKYISTGTNDKKIAEAKLVGYENQINQGTYIAPDKMTLAELLQLWLEEYVEMECEETTYSSYESIVNKYLIPKLGHIPIQKLTAMDITKYYNFLLREGKGKEKGGLSLETVHRHHANLHSALKFAVEKGLLIRNVADLARPPKKKGNDSKKLKNRKAKVYNSEQVKELLEAAKGDKIEVPVNLAVKAGLRNSEICGLIWSDVNYEKGYINIEQVRTIRRVKGIRKEIIKPPKSDAGIRKIKIPQSLCVFLKSEHLRQKANKLKMGEQYFESEYVFRNPDGTLNNSQQLSKLFSNFLKENKLAVIRLHDLRHTYATILLKNKADLKTVQEYMGHADAKILLDTYAHVLEEAETETMNILESAFAK